MVTKFLAISDLHLGNPRVDPFHFQACIEKYVLPQITSDISHLFICGDFFDLLITMNSMASMVASTVIAKLKKACFDAGVKLRVLRGTFTHDRNQPQHFMLSSPEYNACVKFFDSFAIEYDEDTKMNFLYMPDIVTPDIYKTVEDLLESHALKTVDVVIHHGYFKHMLPPGIPEPNGTIDYEKFKRYYTGCVLNGHVHIHSIYNNVISIGSFDRMAYAEEEPKGFYKITKTDNIYSYEFIENKDAYPFWTVDLTPFDNAEHFEAVVDHFMLNWDSKLKDANEKYNRVRIRLMSEKPELVEGLRTLIVERYPKVIVDRKAMTKRDQILENLNLSTEDLPEINVENLGSLLLPLIHKKHPNISAQEVEKVLAELKGTK